MAHFERLAEIFRKNRLCEMSSVDTKWPDKSFATSKWNSLKGWQNSMQTSHRFFENQPNKICSHLSEKASKGLFLNPRSSKITVTKQKEMRKRATRRKGGEEKKAMVALSVFIMTTLEIVLGRKKNCWTEKVHLAVTFSKIRLDI